MFKATKNSLPEKLQSKYKPIGEVHSYNTRNRTKFKYYINNVKCYVKSMCPSVNGVKTFNNLSENIKNAPSISSFKKRIKRMLLSTY